MQCFPPCMISCLKNIFEKISVKYGVLATSISLPLCIYLYVNIVRFLLRTQDLTESFSYA